MNEFSRFKTDYTVRPDDIDMFQHVHNSKYFDYVLAARYDQMRDGYGMSMEQFISDGYGWVVKSASVNYKRPLKMGNKFTVETGIDSMHSKGCRVTFEIRFKENEKLCCDGWFDYILIDIKTGRSSIISEEMMKIYSI